LYEKQQQIQNFGFKHDWLATIEKSLLGLLKAEPTEFVNL